MSIRGGLKCHSAVSGKEFLFWTALKQMSNKIRCEPQRATGERWEDVRLFKWGWREASQAKLLLFNLKRSISLGNESRSKTTSKILKMGWILTWLQSFTLHAKDGVSLSGLDLSFTRMASSAAAAACNYESQQHFNLPRINCLSLPCTVLRREAQNNFTCCSSCALRIYSTGPPSSLVGTSCTPTQMPAIDGLKWWVSTAHTSLYIYTFSRSLFILLNVHLPSAGSILMHSALTTLLTFSMHVTLHIPESVSLCVNTQSQNRSTMHLWTWLQ